MAMKGTNSEVEKEADELAEQLAALLTRAFTPPDAQPSPQEIAVSILAELIAVKHGKVGSRDAADLSMNWEPPKLASREK
jgi:xanthine/CO dehydrogenase XdhC/CoxF family maturation factor